MSLKMDKSNKERLDLLIGFLENDKMAEDMGNVEKAAAEFLKLNYSLVVGMADAFDERDADMEADNREESYGN